MNPNATPMGPGTSPSMGPSMQPGQGGQMGITQRPKQRFIDRVLMRQQAQKTEEAARSMMPNGSEGASFMGSGPGTGNALSMILGR